MESRSLERTSISEEEYRRLKAVCDGELEKEVRSLYLSDEAIREARVIQDIVGRRFETGFFSGKDKKAFASALDVIRRECGNKSEAELNKLNRMLGRGLEGDCFTGMEQ